MSSPTDAEIRDVFNIWDTDGSGDISLLEFQCAAGALNRVMTNGQAAELFAKLDKDNSGVLEFNEFKDWLVSTPESDTSEMSVELQSMRAQLLARHGWRTLEHSLEHAPEPDAAPAAAADADGAGKPTTLRFGIKAGPATTDDATKLVLSLRDASVAAGVRQAAASCAEGGAGKSPVVQLTVGLCADASDVQRLQAEQKVQGLLAMAGDKIKGFLVARDDAANALTITVVAADSRKTAKLQGMAQMAALKALSVSLSISPPVAPTNVAADDLAVALSIAAELPAQIVDMLGGLARMKVESKAASDGDGDDDKPRRRRGPPISPAEALTFATKLRDASLEFSYDSVGDIVPGPDEAPPRQFVLNGGWGFIQSELETKVAPMLAFMPPPIKDAYVAVKAAVQSIQRVDVAISDEIAVGIDATNFDIFQLLPEAPETPTEE